MADFEYSPAPESTDVVSIESSYGLFIGGRFVEPLSGERMKTINPATEEVLSAIPVAGEADVDAAVAAARAAFEPWAGLAPIDRAKYLFRIARVIQERSRELAVLESMNGGKPIKESRDVDVPLVAAHFFYHAGWADKLEYAFPGARPEPIGVCAQVIPWNFPLLMLSWKIAPALATGNTVVLKPAETTPLTALTFASICEQVGLPPGVVNIITGAGATGAALVRHPDVDKVAFTGSTEVGKAIQTAVGGSKRLTLELGGKAANIIFDDAALDQAIEGIVNGIFFNQGHVCCAGSRLLVQESIADRLLDKLKRRLATLRLGDPLDKNTDIGAINSRDQLEKIKRLVGVGVEEGAEMYQAPCELPERGFWFPPTVFTGVSMSHRIAQEEIFGPVLSVMTFRTAAEAVEKANNTPFGLSAGVWTEKGSRILWMADRLRAGVVWANTFNRFDPASPFGGYKESGFGREGGRQGLLAYVSLGPPGPVEAGDAGVGGAESAAPGSAAGRGDDGPNVAKTYKLFIGGGFARSESGRSYEVRGPDGGLLAHAVRASRKDVRDAVAAARKAQPGWAAATAYNRGQVLYRIAEMMESRRLDLTGEVVRAEGAEAAHQLGAAIDDWVWYAGWTDKLDQVIGNLNPVAGPYFNITTPEPIGVLGIVAPTTGSLDGLAPATGSLDGLVARIAPALCGGNAVVVLASEPHPLPAIALAECLATADVPPGVVNVLTGHHDELVPVLAAHGDVDALDVTGVPDAGRATVAAAASGNVKRLITSRGPRSPYQAADAMEMKTVWHPKGP